MSRGDFAGFVHTGTSISDGTTLLAWIDWDAALSALHHGRLPLSGGEQRILTLAASIAASTPACLCDALPGLDNRNLELLVTAVQPSWPRPPKALRADVVLVYEDEGIGTAIISCGMLLDGAKGIAGEIGHCHVPGATGQCNCGRTGCLESVSSAPSFAAAVRELLGSQADTLLPPHPALADMARLGRPDVDDLLARAGHEVGLATTWLINVINPHP